jgi:arabinoxylan arabinofuranohydrolase
MQHRITLLATLLAVTLQAGAQTMATNYKAIGEGNPISASVFCADPTAIDYQGRLYVYGTNDHQQYIRNNKKGSNGYGNIKSLVVFSTDDMVNWTFHGTIDVGKICGSWCGQSWAPSAVWRTTANGSEEFFVYFANGGGSVGVIKGSSPVGPFKSPLSNALIRHGMPGVDPCNWVFDPGVVIDDNGTGWIAFGGGDPQSTGSNLWPGNSRIAKLKPSMIALDGSAVNMPAPYLFEASELNMMNGRYVYTYNTSWSDRNDWSKFAKRGSNPAPSSCSMCYMVSDNPLDPDSWEYRGEYVPNEGNFGMGWGNNHTHLHKYEGEYYLFYHSTVLEQAMKNGGAMNSDASGYRSIGVNKAIVNESTQKISKLTLTKSGVSAIRNLDPYALQQAETMATSGGVSYENFTNISKNTSINTLGNDASRNLQVKMEAGAWTQLRKVDFSSPGATSFMLRAKGTGTLELRLNSKTAKASATLDFSSTTFEDHVIDVDPAVFRGVKTVYFVFTSATNVQFDAWQFTKQDPDAVALPTSTAPSTFATYDLSGRRLTTPHPRQGIVIEQYIDGNGTKRSRKVH